MLVSKHRGFAVSDDFKKALVNEFRSATARLLEAQSDAAGTLPLIYGGDAALD